jgi:hypothetical protein
VLISAGATSSFDKGNDASRSSVHRNNFPIYLIDAES